MIRKKEKKASHWFVFSIPLFQTSLSNIFFTTFALNIPRKLFIKDGDVCKGSLRNSCEIKKKQSISLHTHTQKFNSKLGEKRKENTENAHSFWQC